jgi:hypothetical protein
VGRLAKGEGLEIWVNGTKKEPVGGNQLFPEHSAKRVEK